MIYFLLVRVQETDGHKLGTAPQTPQDHTNLPMLVRGMARPTLLQDPTCPPVLLTEMAHRTLLQDHTCPLTLLSGTAQLTPSQDHTTFPMLPTVITAHSVTLDHSSFNRVDFQTSQLIGLEGLITLVEVFVRPVPHFLAAAAAAERSGALSLEAPPSQAVRATGLPATRGDVPISLSLLILSLPRSKGLTEARASAVLGGSLGSFSTTRGKHGHSPTTWARGPSSRIVGTKEEVFQRVGMDGGISETEAE